MQKIEKKGDIRSITTVITTSPEDTMRLGESMGGRMKGGELIAIKGRLGSGKTVFVKGIALGLGISDKEVSSPTFVFMHEYKGRLRLYHVDLYRIARPGDIEDLGLFEFMGGEDIMAIEWADKGEGLLPDKRIDVDIIVLDECKRKIVIKGSGEFHKERLKMGLALFLSDARQ